MFNENTTRFTPLDFRLTAAAQFGLLSFLCHISQKDLNTLVSVNLFSEYTSARALSQKSMNDTIDALREQIQAQIASTSIGSLGYDILMLVLRQSPVNSAVNTNVFQLSIPGSKEYQIVKNFYPVREDARLKNVSGNAIDTNHVL